MIVRVAGRAIGAEAAVPAVVVAIVTVVATVAAVAVAVATSKTCCNGFFTILVVIVTKQRIDIGLAKRVCIFDGGWVVGSIEVSDRGQHVVTCKHRTGDQYHRGHSKHKFFEHLKILQSSADFEFENRESAVSHRSRC